ncbi:MAG TPA: competence/damage-inducible protein A [Candidatus Methanoperedenaceae archaeon]|nr:competence/damage-inducible protein A [Candidatus Methanoperedenaceae archaeon]
MTDAVLITIGDEVLAGDIVNTNAAWLSKRLAEHGVYVKRISVIPDEVDVIAEDVRSTSADWIIITGGLGPTHDDVTREGIAKALGKAIVEHPVAMAMIGERYRISEKTRVMATMPEGAVPLGNPAGAAPGFLLGNIMVLPGVPKEMMAIFELNEHMFRGEPRETLWITTYRKESDIADLLRDAVSRFGVKIGSYPGEGQVKVKITGTSPGTQDAYQWLCSRLK